MQAQYQTSKACPLWDQPSALSRSRELGGLAPLTTLGPTNQSKPQTRPACLRHQHQPSHPSLQEQLCLRPGSSTSSEPMSYYPFCCSSSRFFRLVRHRQQRVGVDPAPLHPLEQDLDNCFQRGGRYRWESWPLLSRTMWRGQTST